MFKNAVLFVFKSAWAFALLVLFFVLASFSGGWFPLSVVWVLAAWLAGNYGKKALCWLRERRGDAVSAVAVAVAVSGAAPLVLWVVSDFVWVFVLLCAASGFCAGCGYAVAWLVERWKTLVVIAIGMAFAALWVAPVVKIFSGSVLLGFAVGAFLIWRKTPIPGFNKQI